MDAIVFPLAAIDRDQYNTANYRYGTRNYRHRTGRVGGRGT
jgi:hypothetical protein